MRQNSKTLPDGTTLLGGKYCIERHLSSGGFGNTYKATVKNGLFKYVAIKEFFIEDISVRDDNNDVYVPVDSNVELFLSQKKKFITEAERIASLKNPHIVRVHDIFEENNTAYYAMDFIEGESLMQLSNRIGRPLSEKELMQLLPQMLDALSAVHNAGLLHLDVKPDNFMLATDGSLRLIDFGASKQDPMVAKSKVLSAVAYTERYAPLEQMESAIDKFGPWTDIYALGATMLSLLTNTVPPMPSDILDDPTPDKSMTVQVPATVSNATRNLVKWMLSPSRPQRPQNIGEIYKYLNDNGLIKDDTETKEQEKQQLKEIEKHKEKEQRKLEAERQKQERLRKEREEAERQKQDRLRKEREEVERQKQNRLRKEREEAERQKQNRLRKEREEAERQKQERTRNESEETIQVNRLAKTTKKKRHITFAEVVFAVMTVALLLLIYISDNEGIGNFTDSTITCPDENHPHAIDLGLPSGTKWACCNVGASKPEAYGGYYAWGETETKSTYNESTYKYYNRDYVNLGSSIAGTQYDVAHVKWGGDWQMPSPDQIKELLDNCTDKWIKVNGKEGGKFTSRKNGASIFLPAAGYYDSFVLYDPGSYGYYWF